MPRIFASASINQTNVKKVKPFIKIVAAFVDKLQLTSQIHTKYRLFLLLNENILFTFQLLIY